MSKADKPYESLKCRTDDHVIAQRISMDTGLPIIDSVGAALEGWARLPAKVREQIVRARRERTVQSDRRRLAAVG